MRRGIGRMFECFQLDVSEKFGGSTKEGATAGSSTAGCDGTVKGAKETAAVERWAASAIGD